MPRTSGRRHDGTGSDCRNHIRRNKRLTGDLMSDSPVIPATSIDELHQHILNCPIANTGHADLSRNVSHRGLCLDLQCFASISDAHGAGRAIYIHPVVAVVRVEVLASVLVEAARSAHVDMLGDDED